MKVFKLNILKYKLHFILLFSYMFLSFVTIGFVAASTQNIFLGIITVVLLVALVIIFFKKLLFFKEIEFIFLEESFKINGFDMKFSYKEIVWYKIENHGGKLYEYLVFKPENDSIFRIACYTKRDRIIWNEFISEFVKTIEAKNPALVNYYDSKKWNFIIAAIFASYFLIPIVLIYGIGFNREQMRELIPQALLYNGITMAYIGNILSNRKKNKK